MASSCFRSTGGRETLKRVAVSFFIGGSLIRPA
jgi:hypothetical protein